MTEPTDTTDVAAPVRALLAGAAAASLDAELSLDEFMRAAWLAYTGARPGLREALEQEALAARFAELRARGALAQA